MNDSVKPLINGYFYLVYTFLSHKENIIWGHHKNNIKLNKYSIKINFQPIFYDYLCTGAKLNISIRAQEVLIEDYAMTKQDSYQE